MSRIPKGLLALFCLTLAFIWPVKQGSSQVARAEDWLSITSDVFVGGVDGYHTYRIPTLVVASDGSILCFCEGRKKSESDSGDIDLLLKRSPDGGRTWEKQQVVYEEGGDAEITIGNPCPIVDRENRIVHLLFCRNNKKLFYTRSDDNGRSWETPKDISDVSNEFYFPIARWGTGPCHGIETAKERLAAPVWFCNAEATSEEKEYRSGLLYSDDHGSTWKAGGLIPCGYQNMTQMNECTVFEQPSGNLAMNIRVTGVGHRVSSMSCDMGAQWSRPKVEYGLSCSVCQGSSLRISEKDVLFSCPAGDTKKRSRTNLTMHRSSDGGLTWPEKCVVNAGPSGYSDLAAAENGDILCVYECGKSKYNERIRFACFRRSPLLDLLGKASKSQEAE